MVEEEPLPLVMLKLPAGRKADPLANVAEVQEAVVARLLTTTTWFPAEAPEAADAETAFGLEELTVRADRAPVMLLRAWMSLSRFEASL